MRAGVFGMSESNPRLINRLKRSTLTPTCGLKSPLPVSITVKKTFYKCFLLCLNLLDATTNVDILQSTPFRFARYMFAIADDARTLP